ncbi:phosphatidylserine/phosphatidylglycerophosphate/cardiolipin synthase family protein [Parahaliea maris]|uniref:Phosphatidylserine/phosphatidylglycerophosphate/ cardiolipin synthase family protein n=1 Tax=Parahaliea maris TaxID=2716870 RepID=A0A5C8ZQZ7_9GAMM|nr:phosphatidylserine/phosphatidylglycerophosphate/cardiolipin synthase family protein [Parahaliea maris]TXS90775.1 phosphatidylserine/phosphatidylglycerophosphate/cardiolipin synthase family protein [Parahaliea maris]
MTSRNPFYPALVVLAITIICGCASNPQEQDGPQVATAGADSSPVLDPESTFVGSPFTDVGLSGLFPVRDQDECEVAVVQDGGDSFAARMAALKGATKSIRIQTLIFRGDESGVRIAEVLKQKRAEGLDVRVIVDAFSNPWLQTQWMFFDLKQNDIEVEGYEAMALQWLNEVPIPLLTPHSNLTHLDKRYHEKMWIIDGETDNGVVVTGGLNIGNEYFRADPNNPAMNWRDQDVVVRGAVVKDMVEAFDRNFDYFISVKESRGIFNTNLYWDATRNVMDSTGKLPISYTTDPAIDDYIAQLEQRQPALDYHAAACRFVQNRPRLEETYLLQAYEKLFQQAEREIIIANAYFVPTPALFASITAAAQRCVSVKLVTNGPEANNHPQISLVGRGYYKDLIAVNESPEVSACPNEDAGVHIWEWTGQAADEESPSQGTMHSKFAVIDSTISLVGSYNLDPRSEKLNSENAIVFRDAVLSSQLRQLFLENDLKYSRKVTAKDAAAFQVPESLLDQFQQSMGTLFEEEL